MRWENVDDVEALRIGIQLEADMYKIICSALESTDDIEARNLLAFLAHKKRKHKERLEEKYRYRSGHRLLYLCLRWRPVRLEPLNGLKKDLEILEKLIDFERALIEFFQKAATRVHNGNGRSMFLELAREKENHFDFLLTEYSIRKKLKENGLLQKTIA